MLTMKKETKRNKPKRTGVAVNVWIETTLFEALESYLAGIEPETSKKAVITLALRRYLESVGAWPPAK